ncbi:MAG: hypothetical protein ACK47B_09205 [Armatimonadota bacterium]
MAALLAEIASKEPPTLEGARALALAFRQVLGVTGEPTAEHALRLWNCVAGQLLEKEPRPRLEGLEQPIRPDTTRLVAWCVAGLLFTHVREGELPHRLDCAEEFLRVWLDRPEEPSP